MRKQNPEVHFGELIAFVAVLMLATAAFAQGSGNVDIILEDLRVEPIFAPQVLQLEPLSWFTVIEVDCGSCTEGENATFILEITNLAARHMTLNSIILVDTDDLLFGGIDTNTLLSSNKTETFEIEVPLPPATRGQTLFYTPCFTVTDSIGDGEPQQSCERAPRRVMLSAINTESMLLSIYILLALVLLAVAVAYFALPKRFEDFEVEEETTPAPPSA